MQTEIYRIQTSDNDELNRAVSDGEYMLLREELGLPPVKLNESGSVFRFRFVTEDEMKMIQVLFPKKTKVESYDQFIPIEVLEALKEAKETCPYRIVEGPYVHHAKDYDPDPFMLFGVRTEDDAYTFANKVVLVARWGDALDDIATMMARAFEKWKRNRLSDLREIQAEVEAEIRSSEFASEIGKVGKPHFSA